MRKILLLTKTILVSGALFAQDASDSLSRNEEKKALTLSGSADVYYKYDFAGTRTNSFTSFTQTQNQFALGMASIKASYTLKKVSMVADLGFGQRAKDFAYTDEGITQAIKQLYISYSPAEHLTLTAGTWATHVGYEVVDPQNNRNYSMSYMFTNGPFSHTGVKAEYTTGKQGFMVGVSNPADYRIVPDNKINRKSLIAQYSYAPSDAFKLYLNYVGGKTVDTSRSDQVDLAATGKLSNKFSLGLNATYASVCLWNSTTQKNDTGKPWWGTALYLNYDPAQWCGITLRNELFNDHNHLKSLGTTAAGDNIFASTLTASFKKAGFVFMPEIRWDHVNKKALFTDNNQHATANDWNVLFAAIYSF
ncbi:MAG: porin [Niabella sp.]|nr:porin [Niabella sp.]